MNNPELFMMIYRKKYRDMKCLYISRYFALPDIFHQVMGPGNNEV
jgi:hypothetical protein